MTDSDHRKRRARWTLLVLLGVLIAAATLLWRFTPLRDAATPDQLAAWIRTFENAKWAPAAVIGIFVAGGLVVFPLVVLIAATAIVFDPASAVALSLSGSLASAAALYIIGAKFTRGSLHDAIGPAVQKVQAALERQGIIAIAVLRTVPVAPFTLVNLAAGSIGVRFRDYLIGTLLGLIPGISVITAFGRQLRLVWEDPSPARVGAVVGVIAAWIVLSLILQRAVTRWSDRKA
jgi:uncharacterized membrane protein YdjX (TVP38/TMEM64 family)